MSVDPVTFMETGNPGMFNRYAYTFNDPINRIDPLGMRPSSIKDEIGRRDGLGNNDNLTPWEDILKSITRGRGFSGDSEDGKSGNQSSAPPVVPSDFSDVIPQTVQNVRITEGNRKFGLKHIRKQHSLSGSGALKGKGIFFGNILDSNDTFREKILVPALQNAHSAEFQFNGFIAIDANLSKPVGFSGTFGGGLNIPTNSVRIIVSPAPEGMGRWLVHTAFPRASPLRIK